MNTFHLEPVDDILSGDFVVDCTGESSFVFTSQIESDHSNSNSVKPLHVVDDIDVNGSEKVVWSPHNRDKLRSCDNGDNHESGILHRFRLLSSHYPIDASQRSRLRF